MLEQINSTRHTSGLLFLVGNEVVDISTSKTVYLGENQAPYRRFDVTLLRRSACGTTVTKIRKALILLCRCKVLFKGGCEQLPNVNRY